MEFLFFFAFSFVAAMIFNFIYPRIQAMKWAQTAGTKGYIGMTAVTAAAFFLVLVGAGVVMSAVGPKIVKSPV